MDSELIVVFKGNLIDSEVIKEISKYQFICINFANPDMIGHTGNIFTR